MFLRMHFFINSKISRKVIQKLGFAVIPVRYFLKFCTETCELHTFRVVGRFGQVVGIGNMWAKGRYEVL